MFQCLYNKINIKIIISSLIILLTVLSSFGLTKYAQGIQLGFLNLDSIPVSYKVYFGLSSTFATYTPVLVFVFLFSTIELMMHYVFDEQIDKMRLYIALVICFLPVLIYQYFFWYNLISYCNPKDIKNIDDFLNIKYMFDLTLKELGFISNVCWGLLYLGVIYYLHFSNKPILKVLISVILPTILVISIFYIIS